MHTVISVSSPFDGRADSLYRLLARYRRAAYFGANRFCCNTENAEYVIINSTHLPILDNSDAVLLVAGGEVPVHCDGSIQCAVTCNADERALEALQRLKLPVVSCGMSARDTVSVSSVNPDGVSVSLQRAVVTLSGRVAEPHEISVQGDELDALTVACMAAVMILFDDCDDFIKETTPTDK